MTAADEGEDASEHTVRVLYSTQSGRAKACARRTCRILWEDNSIHLHLQRTSTTLDDDFVQSAHQDLAIWADGWRKLDLVILFVSTTGDGEHTDTIRTLWKALLQKSIPPTLLKGVTFSLFGLGDRAYGPQFCAASRKLAVRLLQLGGTLLGEPGYGDDGTAGGGVFADLDQWIHAQLLPHLKTKFKKGCNTAITQDDNLSTIEDSDKVSDAVSIDVKDEDSLPYAVTYLEKKILPNEYSGGEEWNHPVFQQAYQAFWQTRMPLTAYNYHASIFDQNDSQITNIQRESSTNTTVTSSMGSILIARVVDNQRLTAPKWEQDTRHIRLDFQSSDQTLPIKQEKEHHPDSTSLALPYRAGDVLSVMPSNSAEEVERFLSALPVAIKDTADRPLHIYYRGTEKNKTRAANNHKSLSLLDRFVCCSCWPENCTLRGWLTYCADIHALPEREDLWALSQCCSLSMENGQAQHDKLLQLSGTKGSALYTDYILRQKRSWADVLYDFDSLRAPDSCLASVPVLLSLLSPLRPREFSIASSPTKEVRRVERERKEGDNSSMAMFGIDLCVAVVEGTTPLGRSYHGLCSDYLCRKRSVGDTIRCWIRPGSFHQMTTSLQHDPSRRLGFVQPILYIGAGTGIAPLRGLILERQEHIISAFNAGSRGEKDNQTNVSLWGRDDILLFGCRQQQADYYYRKEWEHLEGQERLSIMTAFSQDQWHKIYVQQVLRKSDPTGEHLANLLTSGCVYVAGGAKMARSVKDEMKEMLTSFLGSTGAAKQVLAKAQRQGRYRVEAWS